MTAVIWTRWQSDTAAAALPKVDRVEWDVLAKALEQPRRVASKRASPLAKLARFGDQRNAKDSLRHAENIVEVFGVEGDYDDGQVSLGEAARRLEAAGVEAVLHTTARHTDEAPRWRVFSPTSKAYPPEARRELVGRLNAALGGILAKESFTLGQCYYVGRVEGVPFASRRVHGAPVDELTLAPVFAVGEKAAEPADLPEPARSAESIELDRLRLLLAAIRPERMGEYNDWQRGVSAVYHATQGSEEAFCVLDEFCAAWPNYSGTDGVRRVWDSSEREGGKNAGIGTLEQLCDFDSPAWREYRAFDFSIIPPDDVRELEAAELVLDEGAAVDLDWDNLPENPPPPPFVVPDWLPENAVTLLAADGGTGKSYLMLWVALCIALGRHPFDPSKEIPRRRVQVVSGEDDMHVLQFRVRGYLHLLEVDACELKGWLTITDTTTIDNTLYTARGDGVGQVTKRHAWLQAKCRASGADVLLIDNASLAFGGNEIARAPVQKFLTSLRRITPTVLILAHVDAGTNAAVRAGNADSAKGSSGSTGWGNGARMRWFQYRDPKTDDVVIDAAKANHCARGSQAVMRWSDELKLFEVVSSTVGKPKTDAARPVLLRLLRQAIDKQDVSQHRAVQNSVWAVIEHMDGLPVGMTAKKVEAEVHKWLAEGLVAVEKFKRSNRTEGKRLSLTAAGHAVADERPEGGEL